MWVFRDDELGTGCVHRAGVQPTTTILVIVAGIAASLGRLCVNESSLVCDSISSYACPSDALNEFAGISAFVCDVLWVVD
jgi:hypothetical protein